MSGCAAINADARGEKFLGCAVRDVGDGAEWRMRGAMMDDGARGRRGRLGVAVSTTSVALPSRGA
jgi:hypothetical protein